MGGLPPKDPRYRNPVQPTIISRNPATRKGLGKTQSNQKRRRKNPDPYDRYMRLHNFMSKTCLAATSATVFYRAPENPKQEMRTAAECRPKAIREARYFPFSLPASGRTLATYIFCQQSGSARRATGGSSGTCSETGVEEPHNAKNGKVGHQQRNQVESGIRVGRRSEGVQNMLYNSRLQRWPNGSSGETPTKSEEK